MQWASTIKEVELSHFFKEWPAMWRRFWDIWVVSWVIILGVGFMASPLVPYGYRITNFTCILPIMTQACCHFLYPIVLNPWCECCGYSCSNRADSQCCFSNSRWRFLAEYHVLGARSRIFSIFLPAHACRSVQIRAIRVLAADCPLIGLRKRNNERVINCNATGPAGVLIPMSETQPRSTPTLRPVGSHLSQTWHQH
jgi:hypothetical protein